MKKKDMLSCFKQIPLKFTQLNRLKLSINCREKVISELCGFLIFNQTFL